MPGDSKNLASGFWLAWPGWLTCRPDHVHNATPTRRRSRVIGGQGIDDGVAKGFEVRFRVDTDGIWRLAAF
jgi:hypothetical protein